MDCLHTAPAIRTEGLSCRFHGGFGVHDLDLHVPTGTVYGFLGPNGSGKTTTIRLLLGLLAPQAGRIELFGRPFSPTQRAPLAEVGALVESPSLYPHLSGRANLEITRTLLALPRGRIDEALARVGLASDADRRVREYSLGMRQRLAIALALLGRPRLLILDEPTNGLDPAGIHAMRALLRGLAAEGVSVFVSSHLLAEVELVAGHVGVLQGGRLCFQGTLAELHERAAARVLVRCSEIERASTRLLAHGIDATRLDGETLAVECAPQREAAINRWLVEAGIEVFHLAREPVSLESAFFELTRPALEVAA